MPRAGCCMSTPSRPLAAFRAISAPWALIWASEDLHLNDPLIRGGGQERGLRAGTENVPGIAAFGAAAAVARRDGEAEAQRISALRMKLETGLRSIAPGTVIFGAAVPR